DSMAFTTRLDGNIRAVFAVLKQSGDYSWRVFLGDSIKDDFSPGWMTWWGGYENPFIRDGEMWVNGAAVIGETTTRPQTMSVVSIVPTGGVTADRLFQGKSNAPWIGDIAEVIGDTQPITSSERKSIEDYLDIKYKAYEATAGAPEFTPNGATFTDSVEVSIRTPTPGAQIHYTTTGKEPDGNSPVYTRPLVLTETTTVRASAFLAGMNSSPVSVATFTRASDFSPASIAGLGLWVRTDAGLAADAAGRVSEWRDQSGQGNHLTQPTLASRPVYVPGSVNGLPVLRFDGVDDSMAFTTRFDGNIRAVFAVLKQNGAQNWRT